METTDENLTKTRAEYEVELERLRKELAIADKELAAANKEIAISKTKIKDRKAMIEELHDAIGSIHSTSIFAFTPRLKDSVLRAILENIKELRTEVETWVSGPELSSAERQRLRGASQRRYGFIDEVSDVMTFNPQFIPANVDEKDFKYEIRLFELMRTINITLQQVGRITHDIQLAMADNLYRKALSYYGAVRDSTLRRVEGAQVLYDRLRVFFHRHRRPSAEPTEHEVERDVRALLHGHKEGEIIIENENQHLVGGKHVVIEN